MLPRSSVRRAEGGRARLRSIFDADQVQTLFWGADHDVSVPPFPFLARRRRRRQCAPLIRCAPPIAPLAIVGRAPHICPRAPPPILPICDLFLVPIKCRLFFGRQS